MVVSYLTLPTDILFDSTAIMEPAFTSEKQYAQHIQKALTSAFKVVHEAQAKAAKSNAERRDKNRKPTPIFAMNERLWFWAKSNAEHRIMTNDEEETATLRHKWSNMWQGSYGIIRKQDPRHYILSIKGKEIVANVNRLSRQPKWSEEIDDTAKWINHLQPSNSKPTLIRGTIIQDKAQIQINHIICFPTVMTKEYPCPVSIGKVTKIQDDNEK